MGVKALPFVRFKRINRLYKLTKYQLINCTKTQKAGNIIVPAFYSI